MAAVNVGGRAFEPTRARWSRVWGGVGSRAALLLPTLTLLLVAAALFSVGRGAVAISPAQVLAILLGKVGIATDTAYTAQQAAVLWNIRLPRVLLGMLVGGGLAISGAALQGIFRNPLTDPGLIGVSSGAALGAVGAIILGITAFGAFVMPLAAFIGGLLATLLVYGLARHGGRAEVVTLLLTGIAVNAICGAAVGFLIFLASDAQLRSIVFWSFGSLGGATWSATLAVAPLIIVGTMLLPRWGRALNLLSLGEREARHLGVETERVRLALIVLTALITGAAVAVCGTIGFVGLVVPHLLRLIAGPDHRTLLPASAIGGAALLTLADLFARTVAAPVEIPLGVITALAGGPFFLWLLCRTRRAHGGWG
ncbi:MAG: Vitamin B12 ABC transporter, permease protein BtuC [uncultured Thermomicrobiales bacterium]|uniref:Vitamin B12 ABC transporter, permease protein BtuC n=1 Tax=uncultured Thermomicrobiales bacterium TaxID=1645740 RepID=A0A6J4UJS1_9BACT|nr:MAG: Vitamin B12 ABC transporter, permease protein BtuC [uncultured Thermomicrobiales bacterium]